MLDQYRSIAAGGFVCPEMIYVSGDASMKELGSFMGLDLEWPIIQHLQCETEPVQIDRVLQ